MNNPLQATKLVHVTPPGAIKDDASFTTTSVDTKGFAYATFIFLLGATDIAMAALKLQESDDDGNSDAYADIDGLDYNGDTDIAGATEQLPTATDDNGLFVFEVDLKDRKRYLDLVATAGNGTTGSFGACVCILSQATIAPVTVAEKGCAGVLRA